MISDTSVDGAKQISVVITTVAKMTRLLFKVCYQKLEIQLQIQQLLQIVANFFLNR